MWPALAQLLELLPHFSRLIPALDRFLQSKSAGEEASRRAFESMTEGLRGDLGQVASAHASLYRQLNDQSETLAALSSSLNAIRASLSALDDRFTRVQRQLTRLTVLAMGAVLLLIIVILRLTLVR